MKILLVCLWLDISWSLKEAIFGFFKQKEFLKDNKVDFSDDFVIHLRFSKLEWEKKQRHWGNQIK